MSEALKKNPEKTSQGQWSSLGKWAGRTLFWLAVIILVMGIILSGFVASQLPKSREWLLQQAPIQSICQYVDCSFLRTPAHYTDWSKMSLSDVVVYPAGDGYALSFVLQNSADHPQPLPVLSISHFAADGGLLKTQKITAQQYRSRTQAADNITTIQPMTTVSFMHRLKSLPLQAVRYSLDFANPQ